MGKAKQPDKSCIVAITDEGITATFSGVWTRRDLEVAMGVMRREMVQHLKTLMREGQKDDDRKSE